MSLTVGNLLTQTIDTFKEQGLSSPRLDALLLFEYITGKDRTHILSHQEDLLSTNQVRQLGEAVDRRLEHEPIAYIVGYRDFYGYPIGVDEHVLVPRPESEAIVDYIKRLDLPPAECLDIGTGSGALAIAIALSCSHHVTATDISAEALNVAQSNARELGASVSFMQSDLLDNVIDSYDIIVANLPYVPEPQTSSPNESISHEPSIALYSGKDGLGHYSKLFKTVDQHMRKRAVLLIEHNPDQLGKITKLIGAKFEISSVSPYVSCLTVR